MSDASKGPILGFTFIATVLMGMDTKSEVFTDLPATKALGYPLAIASLKDRGTSEYNQAAILLTVDVDPRSSSYGLPPQPSQMHEGDFIVARTDGQHMKAGHVRQLKEREERGEEVDVHGFVRRSFTPASFAELFEVYKQGKANKGKAGLAELDAPVQVDPVAGTQ
ncbi:hypothetical protein LTS10_006677 [Elasticomyces elasticus]|nr:hypothetical protein LTS10_006677 [Elasticomyces elasticus]